VRTEVGLTIGDCTRKLYTASKRLGVIARARGMVQLANDTGITRSGLYKALSPNGNPSFETVMKIIGAFGVRLTAEAA